MSQKLTFYRVVLSGSTRRVPSPQHSLHGNGGERCSHRGRGTLNGFHNLLPFQLQSHRIEMLCISRKYPKHGDLTNLSKRVSSFP